MTLVKVQIKQWVLFWSSDTMIHLHIWAAALLIATTHFLQEISPTFILCEHPPEEQEGSSPAVGEGTSEAGKRLALVWTEGEAKLQYSEFYLPNFLCYQAFLKVVPDLLRVNIEEKYYGKKYNGSSLLHLVFIVI